MCRNATHFADCIQRKRFAFGVGSKCNCRSKCHHRHFLFRGTPLHGNIHKVAQKLLVCGRIVHRGHNAPGDMCGNLAARLVEIPVFRFASDDEVPHPFLFNGEREREPTRIVCNLSGQPHRLRNAQTCRGVVVRRQCLFHSRSRSSSSRLTFGSRF